MPGFRLGGGGGGWDVVAFPVKAVAAGGVVCLLLGLFGAAYVIPRVIHNQLTGCTEQPKTYEDLFARGCSSPAAPKQPQANPATPASRQTSDQVVQPAAPPQRQQGVYWGFDGIPVAIGTRPDGTAVKIPYEKINWSDPRNRSIASENVAPPAKTTHSFTEGIAVKNEAKDSTEPHAGETTAEAVVRTSLQEKYRRWIESNPNGDIGSFLDSLPSNEARQVVATMLPPDPKLRTKYYQRIFEKEKSRR